MDNTKDYDKVILEITNRPVDDKPTGGVKGLTTDTLNISPYVSESISIVSPDIMKEDVERQLRAIADVSRSIIIQLKALDKRIEALEPKP